MNIPLGVEGFMCYINRTSFIRSFLCNLVFCLSACPQQNKTLGIEMEGGIGTPLAGRIVVAAVFDGGEAVDQGRWDWHRDGGRDWNTAGWQDCRGCRL